MCLPVGDVLGVVDDVLAVLDMLGWMLRSDVLEGGLSCGRWLDAYTERSACREPFYPVI